MILQHLAPLEHKGCPFPVSAALVLLSLLLSSPLRAQLNESQGAQNEPGGTHIFITYKAAVGERERFLAALDHTLRPDLERWKRDGVIRDYLLLEEMQRDTAGWTAMLVLRFERYTNTGDWIAVERKQPGGLRAEALRYGSPVTTYLADRTIAGLQIDQVARDRSGSVFVFKQYLPTSTAAYRTFLTAYVKPELERWGKEGMLAGYAGFANHHATGAPWDVLLMEEYVSSAALSSYQSTREKVDREMSKDAGWRFLHGFKGNVRQGGFPIYVGRLLQAR